MIGTLSFLISVATIVYLIHQVFGHWLNLFFDQKDIFKRGNYNP
jgi:hypothetical protein